jgi:hypothetical protein
LKAFDASLKRYVKVALQPRLAMWTVACDAQFQWTVYRVC